MRDKNGMQAMKDFTSTVYKEFGMRIVILAAYLHKGHPSVSMYVWVSIPTRF